jgi:hypothetical protein
VTEQVCGGGCAATPCASLNTWCATHSSDGLAVALLRLTQTPATDDLCSATVLPLPPSAAATAAAERKQLRPTGHTPAPAPHGRGLSSKEKPWRAVSEENAASLTRPAVMPPSEKNHA